MTFGLNILQTVFFVVIIIFEFCNNVNMTAIVLFSEAIAKETLCNSILKKVYDYIMYGLLNSVNWGFP